MGLHSPPPTSYTGLRANQISSSLFKGKSNHVKSPSICKGAGCQKPFCYRGVVPLFLFWHAFPLFFAISFSSLHHQPCFPGLCRDLDLSGLTLLLHLTFVSFSTQTCWLECLPFVDGSSERGEKDASKITTYPPGAVRFDCELRAVQVSCGFHHSGTFISPASALIYVLCKLNINPKIKDNLVILKWRR